MGKLLALILLSLILNLLSKADIPNKSSLNASAAKDKVIVDEVVCSEKAAHEAGGSFKVWRINKKRKFATGDRARIEDTVHVLVDEVEPHHLKVTFSEPLVNPFKGGIFGHQDKLYKLSNYFAGPDDEASINKAH